MKVKRKIMEINEDLCNGCGLLTCFERVILPAALSGLRLTKSGL